MYFRYLDNFLSVKKDYSPGFHLLGQICEAQNDVNGAVSAYQRAYDLDHTNKQMILKGKVVFWINRFF